MIHDTIKQRLRASLLLTPAPPVVHALARRHAAALQPGGDWSDVPAGHLAHLERTLVLAKALRSAAGALDEPLRRALDFWLAHDFTTDDWRRNQIVVPRAVGEIALLCEHGLSSGALGKVMELLARSRWANWVAPAGWVECTGTALLGVAYNQMVRGSLENAPLLFDAAFGRVFREIRALNADDEGLQSDMSFRAAAGDSVGGGFAFLRECTQFIALAHGTPWQSPAETIKLFAAFVLDGQQWMIRHQTFDAEPPGEVAASAHDYEGLAAIVQQFAQLGNPPRRQELAAFAHRLQGRGAALSGHRYFWRAHLAVHQRPEFYASLRLAEPSLAFPPVADGRMCLLRAGDEHEGLAAATSGAPAGSTTSLGALQRSPELPLRRANAPSGWLAGGVGEGDYGLAVTELRRPGLTGKKAWFFFDESLLCLGTDLQGAASAGLVDTTVNHCRRRGDVHVFTSDGQRHLLGPEREHALPSPHAVEHDGLRYVFKQGAAVVIQSPAGEGDHTPDFQLRINHGAQPRGTSYQYLVLPVDEGSDENARVDEEVACVEVLANSPSLQAARHRGLGLLGIAFWEPGVMVLSGNGRVAANRPCVLLCRDVPGGGTALSIANPGNQPAVVHVEYGGQCVCFELPGGADAGRSLRRLI